MILDNIRGAIKLTNIPERCRFRSWEEFVNGLPELLSVEIPRGIRGIITSRTEPGEEDRDILWLRIDSSGGIVGLYAYQNGWHPFYQPFVEGTEIRWLVGNSADVPEGYQMIQAGVSNLPAPVINHIVSQYVPNSLGGFSYFAVEFIGY